jgi:hypothetical protein
MESLKIIFRQSFPFLIIFVVLLLGLDFIFSNWIIFEKDYANQNKVQRLFTEQHLDEIPVFGSSKARSAFIPDSLGSDVFNYGMEMSNFDVMELLLAVELDKEKTGPIIIEFNHRTFVHEPGHTINSATFVPNLDDRRVRDFMTKYDRLELKHRVPGFRYFGSYFYYLRYYLKETSGNKKIISKGGNFTDLTPSAEVFQNFVNSRLKKIERYQELNEKANNVELAISVEERHLLAYLDGYLRYHEAPERLALFDSLVYAHPERQFLMVYTPQHWSERQGLDNFDEVQALFNRWEAQHKNVAVFDFSQMELADDCFKNSTHLNLRGARAFSSAFAAKAAPFLFPQTIATTTQP